MIKKCQRCGKEFEYKRCTAKYCPDCRLIIQREQRKEYQRIYYAKRKKGDAVIKKSPAPIIRTCVRCGKEFDGYNSAKYCPDCRSKARDEKSRQHCAKRKTSERKTPLPKKARPCNVTLKNLLHALKQAYDIGCMAEYRGGESYLTEEQLAVVERKYPNFHHMLRERREQRFFEATEKFITLYRQFKETIT